LTVFSVEQLQALALLFFKVNDRGAAVRPGIFRVLCNPDGYLIIRSTFLPRILGVLSVVGGLGWLTFLYPPLGSRLFPFIAIFAILGAAALIFWLLVFGSERTADGRSRPALRGQALSALIQSFSLGGMIMSTDVMKERITETSPQVTHESAGAVSDYHSHRFLQSVFVRENSWCQEMEQPQPIILWPMSRCGVSVLPAT